jgi:type II secretory pathway pseudopilin PulG
MRRLAFTVVELLVVIAIIGTLVALLLPAVQAVRESARKTTCLANLKQIAIAAQAHNEAFEHFPNAGGRDNQPRSKTTSGTPKRSREQDWGVFYQILPYIEQQAMYINPNDAEVAALKPKIFFCPSRRPPTTTSVTTMLNGLPAGSPRGAIDYAGNGGPGGTNAMGAVVQFSPSGSAYTNSLSFQTGAIIPRPGIMPGQVSELIAGQSFSDGLSNVLMFGERCYKRKATTLQQDEDNGYFNGWSWDTIRFSHTGKPIADRIEPPTPPLLPAFDYRFGGPHGTWSRNSSTGVESSTGTVMIAMADGSTRALAYNKLDDLLFRQLTNRRDGKFPPLE